MVINLTNSNKMNNHLSYFLTPLNTKEIATYYIENSGHVLEQTNTWVGDNLLLGPTFKMKIRKMQECITIYRINDDLYSHLH
jgi:hypothetical protein